jgi:hypothetical protein
MNYDKKNYEIVNSSNKNNALKRYLYYKNVLGNPTRQNVKSLLKWKWREIVEYVKGAISCAAMGTILGLAVAGKWGCNGGWIMGGITQLISTIISVFFGLIHGFCIGILYGECDGIQVIRDYSYTMNSTLGIESRKIPIKIDPKSRVSKWIKEGDIINTTTGIKDNFELGNLPTEQLKVSSKRDEVKA